MTYSSIPEWVKLVAVILALAAVVFITYHLARSSTGLDISIQETAIKDSDAKTRKLDKQAAKATEAIKLLTTPEREEQYTESLIQSKSDAKITIDSVALLDFNQQSIYFSAEISRLDSIRRDY
jgi:hypothetical protein